MTNAGSLLLFAAAIMFPLGSAFGWGEPHLAIIKAALEVLPRWQQELLGEEAAKLGSDYCLIPDRVYSDIENAKFARMENKPREVYLLNLHLPAQQPENLETLHYFMGKSVHAVQTGNASEAARYIGTTCHQLEDYGSPSLGEKGCVEFTVTGDGKPLASTIVHGTEPAQFMECDATGVSQLQLSLASREPDAKSNYAIWATPTLLKP